MPNKIMTEIQKFFHNIAGIIFLEENIFANKSEYSQFVDNKGGSQCRTIA